MYVINSVNIHISDVVLYLYFLVNLLSLLLTYIIVTIIYIIFLRKKIWDYAITVAVVHLAVTCAGKILNGLPVYLTPYYFSLSIVSLVRLG